jgi:hypothetical protein
MSNRSRRGKRGNAHRGPRTMRGNVHGNGVQVLDGTEAKKPNSDSISRVSAAATSSTTLNASTQAGRTGEPALPKAVPVIVAAPTLSSATTTKAPQPREMTNGKAETKERPVASADAPAVAVAEMAEATKAKGVKSPPKENPDEISIPPAGDLDDKFFVEGEKSEKEMLAARHLQSDTALELEPADPKMAHKMTPAVRARRAKYKKYVTWAILSCGGLLTVALVKHKIARGDPEIAREAFQHDSPAALAVEAVAAQGVAAAQPPAAPLPDPVTAPAEPAKQEPVAAAPQADPSKADAPKADEAKADGKGEAPAAEAPTEPPAPDPKAAAQEKRDCRNMLERGALGKAVDAGERAVTLDPTDGEAWLLLGAAYQQQGKAGEARRCFTSCTKQGKRGPLSECRAMLR